MRARMKIVVFLSLLLAFMPTVAFNRHADNGTPTDSKYLLSDQASPVPSAPSGYQFHVPISIRGNEGFTSDNGVTGGNGTVSDPYIIEGWEINGSSTVGIEVVMTDAYFVIRNVYVHLEGSPFGIVLNGVSNGRVEASKVSNSTLVGIQSSQSSNVSISNNEVKSSDSGIQIFLSHQVTVSGNSLSTNGGGITVEYSEKVIVSTNEVLSNEIAILIAHSHSTTVLGNYISNNSEGVVIIDATGVKTYHNDFVNNTVQASTYRVNETFWDNGYPVGGNFWSDYRGKDNCAGSAQDDCSKPDRLGDTRYVIGSDNRDNYPLMAQVRRDIAPPSWLEGSSLTARNVTQTSLLLVWAGAADDSGYVYYYGIYQDTVLLATVPNRVCGWFELCLSYKVAGLMPDTTYTFKVEAGDGANNWSTDGPSLTITTPATSSVTVTVTTDKSDYYRGEDVSINVSATNLGDRTVSLDFPSDCQFDLRIWDRAGSLVFVLSRNVVCGLVSTHLDLGPGQTVSYVFVWTQVDDYGGLVQPGRYVISGQMRDNPGIPPGSSSVTVYSDISTEGIRVGLSYRTLDGDYQVDVVLYFPDGCFEVLDWGTTLSTSETVFAQATAFDQHGSSTILACRIGTYEVAHSYELGKLQPGTYTFKFAACLRSIDFQQGACRSAGAVSFTVESSQQPSQPPTPASGPTGTSSPSISTLWQSNTYVIVAVLVVVVIGLVLAVTSSRKEEVESL